MSLELVLALVVLVGLSVVVVLSRLSGRTLDLLDPAYGIAALFLLFFGLRPLALALGFADPRTAIEPETVGATVLWMGVPGLAAFGVGYRARLAGALARALPVPRPHFRPRGFTVLTLGALAMVTISLAMAVQQVPGGLAAALNSPVAIQFALKVGGGYVLLAMSALSYAAWIGLARAAFSESISFRDKVVVGMLFLASTAVGYLSGLRANVIIQVLVLIGLWHYAWRHRLRVIDAVVLGAAGFVAVGGLNALRHYGPGRTSELLSTVLDPSFMVAQILSVLSPFDGAAFVLKSVSEGSLDLLYGLPIFALVVAPIPRAIWPTKPVVSTNWMLVEAQGIDPLSNPISTMTIPGELYWQLSLPGVIGGMFLWGLAMRLVYEYRNLNPQNAGVNVIFLAVYFYSLNAFRTSLVTWIIGMMTTSAFLVVMLWIATGFTRPPRNVDGGYRFSGRPARLRADTSRLTQPPLPPGIGDK